MVPHNTEKGINLPSHLEWKCEFGKGKRRKEKRRKEVGGQSEKKRLRKWLVVISFFLPKITNKKLRFGVAPCNRWPCWTCQMADERQTRTEASLDWGVKSRRDNKGSN